MHTLSLIMSESPLKKKENEFFRNVDVINDKKRKRKKKDTKEIFKIEEHQRDVITKRDT